MRSENNKDDRAGEQGKDIKNNCYDCIPYAQEAAGRQHSVASPSTASFSAISVIQGQL